MILKKHFFSARSVSARAGLLLALLGNLAPSSQAMDIVTDGQPRAVIVMPNSPSDVVKYAAKELQSHIEKATGVKIAIKRERDTASDQLARIYIGPCAQTEQAGVQTANLPSNAFRTKITDDAVFLAGKDDKGMPEDPATRSYEEHWSGFVVGDPPLDDGVSMGSLFAVYDWLETQMGVRWLWPDESGTVVPATKNLSAGPVSDKTVERPFLHSRPRLNFTPWPGEKQAQRDKYIYETSVWLRRQRFSRGVSLEYPHAYESYWNRFGKTHPEFFAQRPDGKREPHSEKTTHLVQMCVSNPGLHKQIVEDWLIQRKQRPSLPWINGAENDKAIKDPSCSCPTCSSWDPADSPLIPNQAERKAAINDTTDKPLVSLSDRYAKFWLALQAEGKKHDPNATVISYAYADYTSPPVHTKLNDHIIVGVVPTYAFPVGEADKNDFRKLWDGWAKTGAKLYLRPNYFLTGYCLPYVFAEEFGEEFKYAAKNGMIASDFDSLTGMWGVQGINLYVMGRLNVDPDLSVSSILDEYYAGFGPAAEPVKDYFNYWKAITLKCTKEFRQQVKGGWAAMANGADQIYTPEVFREGRELLEKAKAAASSDQAVLRRLEFIDLSLEHAELSVNALAAFHAQRDQPGDATLKVALEKAKETLDEFRLKHEDLVGNAGILRKVEMWSGWRKPAEVYGVKQ